MEMPLKDIVNKFVPQINSCPNRNLDKPKKQFIRNLISPFKEGSQANKKCSSPKASSPTKYHSDPPMWEIYQDKEIGSTEDELQSGDGTFLKGPDEEDTIDDLSPIKSHTDSLNNSSEDVIDYTSQHEVVEMEKSMVADGEDKDLFGKVQSEKTILPTNDISIDDVLKLLDASIEENTPIPREVGDDLNGSDNSHNNSLEILTPSVENISLSVGSPSKLVMDSLVKDATNLKSSSAVDSSTNTEHKYKIEFNMNQVKKVGNNSLVLNSSTPYCLNTVLKIWKPKSMSLSGNVSDHEISTDQSNSNFLLKNDLTECSSKHILEPNCVVKHCDSTQEGNSNTKEEEERLLAEVTQEGNSSTKEEEERLLADVPDLSSQELADEDILLIDDPDNEILEVDDINGLNKGTECPSKLVAVTKVEDLKSTETTHLPIIEKSEAVLKPESNNYVSNDPQENADNNNPEWELLRKLETDEERYKAVRLRWRNLTIPNPNKNLTYRHRRFKEANIKPPSTVTSSVLMSKKCSHKRALTEDAIVSDGSSKAKRARTQSCTALYDKKIEELKRNCEEERTRLFNEQNMALQQLAHNQEQQHMQLRNCTPWSYNRCADQLYENQAEAVAVLRQQYIGATARVESETEDKLYPLRLAMKEVRIFHSFYQGLDSKDNKDCLFLSDIELEDLLEEDKLYEKYHHFYK